LICPKCGYNYCNLISETNTKGSDYSICAGALGELFFGPLGMACGWTDNRKSNVDAYWVCKKCGYKFKA